MSEKKRSLFLLHFGFSIMKNMIFSFGLFSNSLCLFCRSFQNSFHFTISLTLKVSDAFAHKTEEKAMAKVAIQCNQKQEQNIQMKMFIRVVFLALFSTSLRLLLFSFLRISFRKSSSAPLFYAFLSAVWSELLGVTVLYRTNIWFYSIFIMVVCFLLSSVLFRFVSFGSCLFATKRCRFPAFRK